MLLTKTIANTAKSIDYVQTKGKAKNFLIIILLYQTFFSSDDPNSNNKDINGEFIGLWKIKKTVMPNVMSLFKNWENSGILLEKNIIDLLNELKLNTNINIQIIFGSWIDIDTLLDLKNANEI